MHGTVGMCGADSERPGLVPAAHKDIEVCASDRHCPPEWLSYWNDIFAQIALDRQLSSAEPGPELCIWWTVTAKCGASDAPGGRAPCGC